MKKTEKKQFKELSEEQLQEVTGGGWFGKINIVGSACIVDYTNTNPCPSMRFDSQCNCIG